MSWLHELAIRIDDTDSLSFNQINHFIRTKFDLQTYLISEEISKGVQKKHYHIYMSFRSCNRIESDQVTIRRFLKSKSLLPSQYCVQLIVKTVIKYLVYITKDMNIKDRINISDDYLEELALENQKIENDKKLPVKDKLLIRYLDQELDLENRYQIISFILTCFREWQSLPPTRSLMDQYVTYIMLHNMEHLYTTEEIQIMMYT